MRLVCSECRKSYDYDVDDFCPRCGERTAPQDAYCRKCGANFR